MGKHPEVTYAGNTVYRQKDETFEHLMKRFKKRIQDDGLSKELKRREYYRSPSVKRKEKQAEAEKRRRRAEAKLARRGK